MVNQIHLRNVASYDADGVILKDLKKINIIYGANGSGKTTISNFLANQSSDKYKDCIVQWQNRIETCVYNKAFKDGTFRNGSIPGVFTIGKEQNDAQQKITELKAKMELTKKDGLAYKTSLAKKEQEKIQLENEFTETLWNNLYKKYEQNFKSALRGSLRKELFKDSILSIYKSHKTSAKSFDELRDLSDKLYNNDPQIIETLPAIKFNLLKSVEEHFIWKKKILGKEDIGVSELINKLGASDWVRKGKEFLTVDSVCPFCQQNTITVDFRSQLEDYFDKEYSENIDLLSKLYSDYEFEISKTNQVLLSIRELASKQGAQLNFNHINEFAVFDVLKSALETNLLLIEEKKREPSKNMDLNQLTTLYNSIIDSLNKYNSHVLEYNRMVNNLATSRSDLGTEIWNFLVGEYFDNIKLYHKKLDGLNKAIDSLKVKILENQTFHTSQNTELKILNEGIVSVQPTIDAINRVLSSFGFTNFEIVPAHSDPNSYQIRRHNGDLAEETLSEGEVSLVTFLYFLQLAKGSTVEGNVSTDRILVIDDPISSLDSNVLYLVSALTKQVIEGVRKGVGQIKQVILLTHNIYFHKEISFIDGRTKSIGDTIYWILRKFDNVSTIECFNENNPILSSYDLLWREVCKNDTTSIIAIQNVMRRIIENYFKNLGRFNDNDIIDSFEDEEKLVCRSLLHWVNDGSHVIPDDLFVQDSSDSVHTYKEVFKKIFYNMGHGAHYDMMTARSDS